MKLIKNIGAWLGGVTILSFFSILKYFFLLIPLITMAMGTFKFLIVFTILSVLCSFFPIYRLTALILFTIGLNDIFYYPLAYQIFYFVLFALLVLEIVRFIVYFIFLTVSKK